MYYIEEETKKSQILLHDSGRDKVNFIKKIETRHCGKYPKTPHYFIDLEGNIDNFIPDEYYSSILENDLIDKKIISICLENYGWLRKNPKNNEYINWIGDIYSRGEIFDKKWRNHFFWANYTDKQYSSLSKLIEMISKNNNIPVRSIGHNVKIDGMETFVGIVSRSNYSDKWCDINPSFDFKKITAI